MPTILLVDDDDAVRAVIAMSLEAAGLKIIEAADTVAALSRLKEHPDIDLCIIDLVMPLHVPDGLAFARAAKTQRPELPLILMTGYYTAAARVGDLANSVVYKPNQHQWTGGQDGPANPTLMERPRVLIIEAPPYLAQFLIEELDGFHPIRPFELVVLSTEVGADDLAHIKEWTRGRADKTIILTHPNDASDNVHPIMLMPGSAKKFADLLSARLINE
jgi:CheY-like chemotaxis protein